MIHRWGGLIFGLGILASTLLTGGLTWAAVEATQYGFTTFTNEHFDGLACPLLMTSSESAVIKVSIRNPSDLEITPIVSIDLSKPGLLESHEVQALVPAGQTGQLEWVVSSRNIDDYYFIFAKINRSASYPMPEAEALCGILVLDLPWSNGGQILLAWLAVCLVCIPLGMGLWSARREPAYETPGVVKALAVMALTGLLVGLAAIWLLGVLCLVVTVLLVVGRLAAWVTETL